MKRIFSLTLALLLAAVLMLPVTAGAYSDYDLVYDATDQLDPDFMRTLGEDTFYQLTEAGGVEVRVDVVDTLEGETIQDYAQIFYDAYDYGYGDRASCIDLMIAAHMEDGSLVFDDYYVFLGGGAPDMIPADMLAQLNTALEPFYNPEAWNGSLAQDVMVCESGLVAYASFLNSYLANGAVTIPMPNGEALGAAEGDRSWEETEDAGDGLVLISPAPQETAGQETAAQGSYVMDFAGILTADEQARLESMAASASAKYDSGVYVVTVNDYRDYNSESVYEAAKTIYKDYGLGMGSDHSGTMLLLSMNDRDYYHIATGEFGNYAFTDYGKEKLDNEFLDDFRNNDWYSGFYDFISESERYMAEAAAGNPVDVEHISTASAAGGSIVLGAAVSCAGSAIKCNGLKKKMKTVKTKADASQYIAPAAGIAAGAAAGIVGGVILRASTDQFINTTVTRVPIVVNNDNNKGGWSGGTTIDSGGFSGHGGKF